MAKTRAEDIPLEAKFGRKLFRQGEKIGRKGPAAIADALYENDECFKIISPRGREKKYKVNKDKDIGAIMRRVQDHLMLANAYDAPSNYMYAYSILFDCSLDFLYGKIEDECPNLEILDMSNKTGLSVEVVKKLVDCSKDGESPIVGEWSTILGSPLFESVHKAWRFVINTAYDKLALEGRLAALQWEKKYLADKHIDPNDETIFEFPRDIEWEISSVDESISSKDASLYGMLSKVSKNFADFIEDNVMAFYRSSQKDVIDMQLRFKQQAYEFMDL